MLRVVWLSSAALAFVSLFGSVDCPAANVLLDPGFETSATGASINGWQTYGGNTYVNTGTRAHTGTNFFKVYGNFSTSDNYSGILQDVASGPGAIYTADIWAYSLTNDAIRGSDQVWAEVTFRDISGSTLALYRSDIVTSNNITAYGGFAVWFDLKVTNQWAFYNQGGVPIGTTIATTVSNLVAPAGTSFVRYQLVFHQGPDNANGSAYLDDCVLNQVSAATNTPGAAWNIVWSDEFNGTTINTNTWIFETGNNNGWGNGELENYTARPQNAYASNGLLHIVALKESLGGFNYTSARMKTQNHFQKAYGRFEFRAKLPAGPGYWPALWMLGANFPAVGWPACGEIDVMENNGSNPNRVQGTIHYSDSNNNHLQSTGYYNWSSGGATNFHSYMLEWQTNVIRWSVDGQVYEAQTTWSSSTGPFPAPFNQPYFIIMNLAVGGAYLGNPPASQINTNTIFPGDMQVDYIRVYDLTAPLRLSVTRSNSNVVLSWPANIVCHLQAQTSNAGISSNWTDVTAASNPYIVPATADGSVFYRLKSP